MISDRKAHWQQVYSEKDPTEVSWYQPVPEKSLQLIRSTGVAHDAAILDAGGGASMLVDHLLDAGYTDLTVLDISGHALDRSRARLGELAGKVEWIESDVTEFDPDRRYALWHDRAVFHFLTDDDDRDKYFAVMRHALQPGGYFVLATFGPQGPKRCSGLEIVRYGVEMLEALLGTDFRLSRYEIEDHGTPMGSVQQFLYSSWQVLP